jgi:hypothetical protein
MAASMSWPPCMRHRPVKGAPDLALLHRGHAEGSCQGLSSAPRAQATAPAPPSHCRRGRTVSHRPLKLRWWSSLVPSCKLHAKLVVVGSSEVDDIFGSTLHAQLERTSCRGNGCWCGDWMHLLLVAIGMHLLWVAAAPAFLATGWPGWAYVCVRKHTIRVTPFLASAWSRRYGFEFIYFWCRPS